MEHTEHAEHATPLEVNDLVVTSFFTHDYDDCVEEMQHLCGRVGRVIHVLDGHEDSFVVVAHGSEIWNWLASACQKICNLRDIFPEGYS